MLIDVKANLWFAGAHLVFILNGTMTGVWGGRKIKSNQICRGERKETSVVFASYYTAIFGSLMSEKVKALVLGDGEMHGLPSVMLYTQAERVGSGRVGLPLFYVAFTALLLVRTPLLGDSGGWGKAYETHIAS